MSASSLDSRLCGYNNEGLRTNLVRDFHIQSVLFWGRGVVRRVCSICVVRRACSFCVVGKCVGLKARVANLFSTCGEYLKQMLCHGFLRRGQPVPARHPFASLNSARIVLNGHRSENSDHTQLSVHDKSFPNYHVPFGNFGHNDCTRKETPVNPVCSLSSSGFLIPVPAR